MLICRLFRTFLTSPLMLFIVQRLSGNSVKTAEHCICNRYIHTDFYIKIVRSSLNGIKVAMFASYSIKICIILGVRFERQKVDKKQMKTEACKLYCRVF